MPRHKTLNRAEYRRRRQHYLSLRLCAQIKAMNAAHSVLTSNKISSMRSTGSIFDIQEREQEEAAEAAYQALREELKTYRREEDMIAMEKEIVNHQMAQGGLTLCQEQFVTRLPRLKFGDGL